jgi:mRNA-degrading endonuclease RelE of RelBE toxin-antitoxin system
MAWNLQLAGPAQKDFRKLPANDRQRVRNALLAMQDDPFQGDIKRIVGQPTAWRRRVGSYRILYDLYVDQRLIVVAGIVRRSSTTY